MRPKKIIKESGKIDDFSREKLKASLTKSGASKSIVQKITGEIETALYDGVTTREIYKNAFEKLRKYSRSTAARYKLKKGIMELGPTGFPFERFIAAILIRQGLKVQIDVSVKGHCVNHEVDVIAEKEGKHFMVECKFHGVQSNYCNVKIPLYVQSRFKDIEKQWQKNLGHETKFHQGWVFTNTRFTTDAIQYGTCVGLGLVGWDYPKQNSLKEQIDTSGLHPVTSLTTLTKVEKQALLEMDHVLCMDICDQPTLLTDIAISENRQKKILKEARELCNIIKYKDIAT